ncbi:MAG: PhnD/SsuA/transferrin family substrate-binding protein [Archangiaceae bacterium]|nr:PhnD/SsuA/transferrin family substrate-binding protein [Archangiaceae bacterium]
MKAVSLLSDSLSPCLRAVTQALGPDLTFVEDVPWPERERQLERGEAQLGFTCGLLFMRKREAGVKLRALAAPVFAGEGYRSAPIYFSDVVVRAESPARGFADLRGCTWAFNEPGSYSGYAAVQHHLATLNARRGYFARAVQTGSHLASLRALLDGAVDATALDSTVLDDAQRADPALARRVRVIERLGPSPSPPVVAAESLGAVALERLTAALLAMKPPPPLARFAACRASDYEVLAERAGLGKDVSL